MSLLSDLNNRIKALSTRIGTEVKNLWGGVSTAQTTADDIAARAVVVDAVDQNIAGRKLFTNPVVRQASLTIGVNPTATQYSAIHWSDTTGDTSAAHRLATVEYSVDSNGTAGLIMGPYQYIEGKTSYTGQLLSLRIAADGTTSASVNNLTVNGYLQIPGGRIWIA